MLKDPLNLGPLLSLHAALCGALAGWIPRDADSSPYTPHMTLFYGDPMRPHAVQPMSWCAKRIVLVRSLVGRTEHRHLGSWPLS